VQARHSHQDLDTYSHVRPDNGKQMRQPVDDVLRRRTLPRSSDLLFCLLAVVV